ncbi:hypothetical protein D3C72_2186440 [compost metagenome]
MGGISVVASWAKAGRTIDCEAGAATDNTSRRARSSRRRIGSPWLLEPSWLNQLRFIGRDWGKAVSQTQPDENSLMGGPED